MFEHKIFTMDLAGRELSVEIGKIAELASGSAIIKCFKISKTKRWNRLLPSKC